MRNKDKDRNLENQNEERRKPGYTKEWVENADVYQHVLNKIMITRE